MRHIYIHVGPPKTGTSAVQHLLHARPDMGVFYPHVGLWKDGSHHNLVFNFFGDRSRPETVLEDSAVQFERIRVLATQDDRDLLISSEALAGRDVGAFTGALLKHLGAEWQAEILFVCREHFDYVASLYNQNVKDAFVHEQRAPGAYLCASPEVHCLMPKLERLEATGFPLRVLNYHPDADFAQRFMSAVGMTGTHEINNQRRNTSLGVTGLIAMLCANQVLRNVEEIRQHLRALSAIRGLFASAPLIFDRDSMAAVAPIFAEDRDRLQQIYGVALPVVDISTREDRFFLTRKDYDRIAACFRPLGIHADSIMDGLGQHVRAYEPVGLCVAEKDRDFTSKPSLQETLKSLNGCSSASLENFCILTESKITPTKGDASMKKLTTRKPKSSSKAAAEPATKATAKASRKKSGKASKTSDSPLDAVKETNIPESPPAENRWLTADLSSLNVKEIQTGAVALDKDADAALKQNLDAAEMKLRNRAIELLEHVASLVPVEPGWKVRLYGKQLKHLAVVCHRAADQLETIDDDEAVRQWDTVGRSIEKLYAIKADQPGWINKLSIVSAQKCAVALGRLAKNIKVKDSEKFADYKVMSSRCLEMLYARHADQPEWVGLLFLKNLYEGAEACDLVATHAKNNNNEKKCIHYWFMASDCIRLLYARNPEQPQWVANLFVKSLKQYIVECARLAVTAKNNNENKESIHYWLLVSEAVEKLCVCNIGQPEWAENKPDELSRVNLTNSELTDFEKWEAIVMFLRLAGRSIPLAPFPRENTSSSENTVVGGALTTKIASELLVPRSSREVDAEAFRLKFKYSFVESVHDQAEFDLSRPKFGGRHYIFKNTNRSTSGSAIYEIENATISLDSNPAGQVRFYIFDATDQLITAFSSGETPFIESERLPLSGRIAFLDDRFSRFNICHLLADKITRLGRLGSARPDGVFIVTDSEYARFMFNTLEVQAHFGLPQRPKQRVSYRVERLLVSDSSFFNMSHPGQIFDKISSEFIANTLRPALCKQLFASSSELVHGQRRIYVSRQGGKARVIQNVDAVEEVIKSHGFETVHFERMSIDEQLRCALTADCMLGVHGAGLTNAMFMPRGAMLLELLPPLCASSSYWLIAHGMGLHYDAMIGTDPAGRTVDYTQWKHDSSLNRLNLHLDPGELDEFLRGCLKNS